MLTENQIKQVRNYVCAVCDHERCNTYLCMLDFLNYDQMETIYNEKLADIDGQLELPFGKEIIKTFPN